MNIIPIYPEYCNSINITEYEFCLPPKVKCDDYEPTGLLSYCSDISTCGSECGQDAWFIPAVGSFYVQSLFKTSSAPVATIRDLEGNIVTAPGAITGTVQKKVQTYLIDPSLIPVQCFQVKIVLGEVELCSQYYKKLSSCDSESDYVSFEAIHKNSDCNGQQYGDNGYSNKIWLKGKFKYYTSSVDDDGTTEVYRFYPSEAFPGYMLKYLSGVILGAKKVLINGKEYKYNGSGDLAPLRSGMYAPVFEFTQSCGGKTSCEN